MSLNYFYSILRSVKIIKGKKIIHNKKLPKQEHIINEQITFPKVLVITEIEKINSDNNDVEHKWEKIGVLETSKAIELAKEQGKDLVLLSVEVSKIDNTPRPIAKIMDLGKYKYKRKKQQKEQKEKQTIIKNRDIKVSFKINDNDIAIKAKKIREFLLDKDRVKVSVKLRGREVQRPEIAKEILLKFYSHVEDIAKMSKEIVFSADNKLLDLFLERDKKKKPELTSFKVEKNQKQSQQSK